MQDQLLCIRRSHVEIIECNILDRALDLFPLDLAVTTSEEGGSKSPCDILPRLLEH